MSQNNSNAKTAMLAKLDSIHKVEGFDPSPFAVDYTDLNTQETRKRLPVMIQMAWFRLKYPEGRIAIQVSPGKDCFVATARIYRSFPAETRPLTLHQCRDFRDSSNTLSNSVDVARWCCQCTPNHVMHLKYPEALC